MTTMLTKVTIGGVDVGAYLQENKSKTWDMKNLMKNLKKPRRQKNE